MEGWEGHGSGVVGKAGWEGHGRNGGVGGEWDKWEGNGRSGRGRRGIGVGGTQEEWCWCWSLYVRTIEEVAASSCSL